MQPGAPAKRKIFCVSVDLDPLECYQRIHGLSSPVPQPALYSILRRTIPRLSDLFAEHDICATFFVVGRDLSEDPEARSLLYELHRAGHEIANHTYSHAYNLVRLERGRILEDIARAHMLIGKYTGCTARGFRAPGYAISPIVLEVLNELGYCYDSSVFPSLPYYCAKAAVMGLMRLVGRPSSSILDTPCVLRAPRLPYHPACGDPYRRGNLPLIELPITVTPLLRLPVIGTLLVTAPAWLRRYITAYALRMDFFNLELHGIDLSDAATDNLPQELIARQPDLRVPYVQKRAALSEVFAAARAAGMTSYRLGNAADYFAE
jgi:hypothetical protein